MYRKLTLKEVTIENNNFLVINANKLTRIIADKSIGTIKDNKSKFKYDETSDKIIEYYIDSETNSQMHEEHLVENFYKLIYYDIKDLKDTYLLKIPLKKLNTYF